MGTLELLPGCNMSCGFCYVNRRLPGRGILGTYQAPRPLLFPDDRRSTSPAPLPAEKWLQKAEEMRALGCLFLLLTGGEPFLYPDFLSLYERLRAMGFVLSINTNGTRITPDAARRLGAAPPRRVSVTLYGTSNQTYASLCHVTDGFDRALRGIRLLREADVPVRICCSAVRGNRDEIPEIFALGHAMGIPVFAETYMLPDPALALHRIAAGKEGVPAEPVWRLTPEEAAALRIETMARTLGEERFQAEAKKLLASRRTAIGRSCARSLATSVQLAAGTSYSRSLAASVQPGADGDPLSARKKTDSSPLAASRTSDESLAMTCLAGRCAFAVGWDGTPRLCVADDPAFRRLFTDSILEASTSAFRQASFDASASAFSQAALDASASTFRQSSFDASTSASRRASFSRHSSAPLPESFREQWSLLQERRRILQLPKPCASCPDRLLCRICPVCRQRELPLAGSDMIPPYLCSHTAASWSALEAAARFHF